MKDEKGESGNPWQASDAKNWGHPIKMWHDQVNDIPTWVR